VGGGAAADPSGSLAEAEAKLGEGGAVIAPLCYMANSDRWQPR
jgi:hypothetical protein